MSMDLMILQLIQMNSKCGIDFKFFCERNVDKLKILKLEQNKEILL